MTSEPHDLPRGLRRILDECKGVEAWKSVTGGFRVTVGGKRGFVASWKIEAVERELDRPGSLGPHREALVIDFVGTAPRSGRDRRRYRGRDRR
jgi:hypothetical protein